MVTKGVLFFSVVVVGTRGVLEVGLSVTVVVVGIKGVLDVVGVGGAVVVVVGGGAVVVDVVVGCVGCGGQGQESTPGEGGPLTQVSQLRYGEKIW